MPAVNRAAIIYTIIETAKMNGLDPETYLRAVIARIADHPSERIGELLPWNIALRRYGHAHANPHVSQTRLRC
jgi:hypothetical protein